MKHCRRRLQEMSRTQIQKQPENKKSHKDPYINPRMWKTRMGLEEIERMSSTDLAPERRVEAMENLGDLRLAIWGRANDGSFGDWVVQALSLRAIVFFLRSLSAPLFQYPPHNAKPKQLYRERVEMKNEANKRGIYIRVSQ